MSRAKSEFRIVIALLSFCGAAGAEPILPDEPGSVWQYTVTESSRATATIVVRISGKEERNGQPLLRLETLTNDALTKTEWVSNDERGVLCYRRAESEGKALDFDPPEILIRAPLAIGAQWDMNESVAGSGTRQQFSVVDEEDVIVPAGTFHAFHARSDQPWPLATTTERWFVVGLGLVKNVTSARGPSGRLLSRVTTALTKFSRGTAGNPEPSASPSPAPTASPPPKITLEVAKERDGPAVTEFRSDAPNIFVRWRGENLPVNVTAHIAWVAEDVGDIVSPNFVVDEIESAITKPDFAARFTLSRPKDGWATGTYRAELYLEEELLATVKVTIRD